MRRLRRAAGPPAIVPATVTVRLQWRPSSWDPGARDLAALGVHANSGWLLPPTHAAVSHQPCSLCCAHQDVQDELWRLAVGTCLVKQPILHELPRTFMFGLIDNSYQSSPHAACLR